MTQIYIDAASRKNPTYAAGAVVIKDSGTTTYFTIDLGPIDNHEAEWATFVYSLECAKKLNKESLIIYTDAKIIVDSIDKGYVKNNGFKPYFLKASKLMNHFTFSLVTFLPRDKNKEADIRAKEALYKCMNI